MPEGGKLPVTNGDSGDGTVAREFGAKKEAQVGVLRTGEIRRVLREKPIFPWQGGVVV